MHEKKQPRSLSGLTDVLLVGLLHLRNDGLVRRVDGRECLAADAVAPLVVDQKLHGSAEHAASAHAHLGWDSDRHGLVRDG